MKNLSIRNLFPDFDDKTVILHNSEDFFLILNPKMKNHCIGFIQPNYYSFILMRNGQIKSTVDGISYHVNAGSSIAILPRQHVLMEEESDEVDCIVYLFSSQLASKIMVQKEYSVYLSVKNNPVRQYSPEEMRIMEDLVILQHDVLKHPDATRLIELNTMLLNIGFRLLSSGSLKEDESDHTGGNRHELMMMRFTQLLDQYYLCEHRVAWYANQMCITPKYLNECSKRATNQTAGWWIDHYLMRDAIRLLQQKQLSVKATAARLGFEDQSAFGKWFKRIKGISPRNAII